MVVGAERHQADKWAKQAMELLDRGGLLPTPHNYGVYYEYVSGRNYDLCSAFEQTLKQGKITQQACDEMYYKYVVSENEKTALNDANSVVDQELKKVLQLIKASELGTDQFHEELDTFSGKLEGASSIEVLREAIQTIADKTQMVAEQNSRLKVELSETSAQLSKVRDDYDKAHREALIDTLTEVGNRKFFDREIVRTLKEAKDQDAVVSLLMVDIDHFKKFNDTHGHLIGDQVLRLVAHTMVENLKGRDVIARYGGEEFVIVLPHTRLQDAERVANSLRMGLATKNITKRGSNEVLGTVTISIGAAEYHVDEDPEALVARADAALYKAKQSGRNKVVAAPADE